MNEEVVTVNLKEIPEILHRYYEELERFKCKLDRLLETIKQICDREKKLHSTLNSVKKVSEALQLFLCGAKYPLETLMIQELESINNDISNRLTKLREELNSRKVGDEDLEHRLKQYHDDISSFIEQKQKLLTSISERQINLFDDAKKKIQDKFNVLERLTDTLKKGIPQNRIALIKHLEVSSEKIQQIIHDFPESINELVNRFEEQKDSIKGLYARTSKTLSQVHENIRRFAIENELLSENEIVILETLSAIKDKEMELGEVIELLEKKLTFGRELVKGTLLALSEKGFITLKVVI